MKRAGLMLGLMAFCWSPALAADRLTDRDVKPLVDRIEKGRDRFDDTVCYSSPRRGTRSNGAASAAQPLAHHLVFTTADVPPHRGRRGAT